MEIKIKYSQQLEETEKENWVNIYGDQLNTLHKYSLFADKISKIEIGGPPQDECPHPAAYDISTKTIRFVHFWEDPKKLQIARYPLEWRKEFLFHEAGHALTLPNLGPIVDRRAYIAAIEELQDEMPYLRDYNPRWNTTHAPDEIQAELFAELIRHDYINRLHDPNLPILPVRKAAILQYHSESITTALTKLRRMLPRQ